MDGGFPSHLIGRPGNAEERYRSRRTRRPDRLRPRRARTEKGPARVWPDFSPPTPSFCRFPGPGTQTRSRTEGPRERRDRDVGDVPSVAGAPGASEDDAGDLGLAVSIPAGCAPEVRGARRALVTNREVTVALLADPRNLDVSGSCRRRGPLVLPTTPGPK